MGCSSCSSGGCGTSEKPGGCKSNGGCSTGGCNRLNVFDWLSDMDLPASFEEFDIVEIRFKGGRKDFYRNANNLRLTTGDAVVVDVPNGHHIGFVSLKGELVRLQMLKKKVERNEEIRTIYRIATEKDMEKFDSVRELEGATMYRGRSIIQELQLKMKLSDVEYQADRSKATFYYSADDRIDFRELIKKLADEFKIRVEMRQISLRHEAGRLGGIGSCGRELCCATWLTDFKSVSTTAARYQNLSLNPSKLSGQCGRLKCCLNYELETYMDALKDIPSVNRALQTKNGDALLQKTDIFKRIMWFGFKGDNNWHPVPIARVKEIQEMNAKGEQPEFLVVEEKEQVKKIEFAEALEGSLERLDDKFKNKSKKKNRKKPKPGGQSRPVTAATSEAAVTEGSSPATATPDKDRPKRQSRPNRPAQNRQPGDKTDRPERPERNEKRERPERTNQPERSERPERQPRPERAERGPRPERTDRPERQPQTPRPPRAEGEEGGQPRQNRPNRNRRNNNRPRPDKPTVTETPS